MAKSKYEFWLSQGKEKLRLPVLPEKIDIGGAMQNESVKVSGLGELTFIEEPGAREISFASFFPKKYTPLCEYRSIPNPENAINTIMKWRNKKEPIRLIVTGTKINFNCSLEAFDYSEGDGAVGDRDFSLQLKEYKTASPRKIKVQKPVQKKRPAKAASRTWKVKKGDTLWAIAGKEYGNNLQWRKIWNANKDMMIKRDRRNIRMPGHWIYPGQVLKIPA
ncbi:LysM peptidoglycan-binding domain-containing protein [Shouchella clausii]|uniref:LysM peptidoglycan-binding domain-containing protein n=1 Tax=Shouchella clausii TaxID=79880 RepID=UPI001C7384DE|nr:LysM peptidoglycan-binding domain-containing protein [Shouchella clausii]MBX0319747.1 LysM peptidoglycan-binding domain-containing protein [Shouchella clausii]